MKRNLALVLALAMLIGLAGCSTGQAPDTTPEKTSGGTLNTYVGNVATLNPFESSETQGTTLIEMCSLGMYKYMPNEDNTAIIFGGQLAAGDPVCLNDDGTLWEIKIRENAYWENGDHITIDDFIYSIQMVLDPVLLTRRASQVSSEFITIVNASDYYLQGTTGVEVPWDDVGIKKIDDYTVQIEITNFATANDVKTQFSTKYTSLVHKPTFEACFSADRTTNSYGLVTGGWMSCGPYIMTTWVEGSQYVFDRNPDYVLADMIKLDKVVYHVISDSNTALEMFLSGQIDTVSLGAAAIEQYEDDPRVYRTASEDVTSININIGNTSNNGILGNVNFRQALFYATDRVSIAKLIHGQPATWIVCSAIVSDTATNVPFRSLPEAQAYLATNNGYDPELAREYFQKALDEVGLESVTIEFLLSETATNTKTVTEFLQQSWPSVFGEQFTLQIVTGSSSVVSTARKGWTAENPNTYQLAWGGWSNYLTDVANGFKFYTSSYTNKNEPYYNEHFDELFKNANYSQKGKTDNEYRLSICFELEQIMLRDMITIPVYESEGYRMISDRVHLPLGNVYTPTLGWGWMYATVD